MSLTDLAARTGIPYATVHREVERAESTGILTSRKVGRTRLIRADTTSPYFEGLADVMTKAFRPPQLLASALAEVDGIDRAFIYGSWAARNAGETGVRPVGDIDVLVLGEPDRDALFAATSGLEQGLGRPVQVTIRSARWLEEGSGSFHDTVTERPLLEVPLGQVPPISCARSGLDHPRRRHPRRARGPPCRDRSLMTTTSHSEPTGGAPPSRRLVAQHNRASLPRATASRCRTSPGSPAPRGAPQNAV